MRLFGFSMFSFMETVFPIAFFIIFGMIVITAVKGILKWNKNNRSPVLTVQARVVNMREDMHHHHMNAEHTMHSTSTTYYATFEVESGDRIELTVPGNEYGMLARGDEGRLTFQGTRYHAFARRGDVPHSYDDQTNNIR